MIEVSEPALTALQTTILDDPISVKLTFEPNKEYKFKLKATANGNAVAETDLITVILNKIPYFDDIPLKSNITYEVKLPIL